MAEEPRPISRQADPPFATEPALRLSIFHLMVWTFCSAAYLAWSRFVWNLQTSATPFEASSGYMSIRQAIDVVQSLVMGGVLTGAITLAFARTRVRPGGVVLSHPGHWLL